MLSAILCFRGLHNNVFGPNLAIVIFHSSPDVQASSEARQDELSIAIKHHHVSLTIHGETEFQTHILTHHSHYHRLCTRDCI